MSDVQYPESDIAIVGMSGHFPGAPDPETLWARIVTGDDCLVDLDRELLIADGVPAHVARSADYVARSGVLTDVDMFDPGFFGIGRRDAAIMDPQQRHFLECVWEALESAGHVPERFAGSIGVFAGCGANTYMLNNLLTNPQLVEQVGWFLLRHTGNDKDFLATTASYKLDLRGPSVNVQTACSTSLVAVHLAVQSLLGFECDMAVAGGVTIEVPHARGYEYREGEILSPTGVCRAFDVDSAGTVLTSGAGVVALRRLQDAVDDGDPILAVIKGSAVNNDGARKVGYLAPSVDGHADVVKEALAVAGLDARSISLLEAHGTGTAVGDPIEVAALTEAFRASTNDAGFCRLVSTKPNIGHLDTAAGTASLIKVVQALRHRTLPPMANYGGPSPLLDIERTPFVLSGEAAPWETAGPRRAGVSSLGVGGTNAHVIVEEAPELPVSAPAESVQVLVLSGRDAKSTTDASDRLAAHLDVNPDVNLADVAATLFTGRRAMRHRRIVVATDTADAVVQLRGKDRARTASEQAADDAPGVAFMFPGGGSQYVGMAAGLDHRFDVFHATLRHGFDIVRTATGLDLAPLVAIGGDDVELRNPTASLPAVFVTSVALARQWMAWGITPDALVGHSLGEYVAAHLAGVLSFEDAMSLVIKRSRLMQDMAGDDAAMLIVPLPEADVMPLLGSDLSLAVVNTRDECVVAGPGAAIDALLAGLPADAGAQRIPLAAAAHSSLLDPILPEFLEAVRAVKLSPPTIRYVSNLTGTWITPEQATDPQYWVDHLRHTVRFADCLATVLADGPMVLAELGPGHALSSFARRADGEAAAVIAGLRHPNQVVDDTAFSLLSFARLWGVGVDVDLERFAGTGRRRLRLPTYPFQRERFWIEPGAGYTGTTATVATDRGALAPAGTPTAAERPRRIDDIDDVFWIPSWQPSDPPSSNDRRGAWVVVGDHGDALVGALVDELVARGARASAVSGDAEPSFDDALDGVVIVAPVPSVGVDLERSIERWLDHGTAAARALGGAAEPGRLVCVSRDALNAGASATRAVDALAAGVVAVAPREYPGLTTRLIDVDEVGANISDIVDDVLGDGPQIVALRSGGRLTPDVEREAIPAVADAVTFRRGGTYLVTGAFGGVGSVLASHLATQHEANLVLLSTDDVPDAAMRDHWLATHSYDDPTSRRIRKLRELEAGGTKIAVVVADVADPAAVRHALDEAERRVGPIDGAIHAAGRLRDRLIEMAEPADHRFVIEAKAGAALTLVDELERRGTQLLVLVSSTSTLLQPDGQTSYVAANSVLDALAGQHGRLRVSTINFGLWANVGIASDAGRRAHLTIDEGEPVEHPVLSERSQGRDGTVRLVGRLDSRHHWVVDEHRVPGGNALLPGTGHLELMLAGARFAGHADPQLSGVALLAPLVVRDGRPTTVRVTVTPGDRPTVSIESDGGTARSWIMHSEARITGATGVAGPYEMDDPMLDGVDPLAGPRRHLALGPHWDAVVDARLGDGVAIADLRLAERYSDEPGPWQAHPALVDVATAVGVALAPPHAETVIYVPIGYERVWIRNPLPASFRVRARRSAATSPDLLRVDLLGLDDSGEAVMDVVGLDLLPVTQHGHLAEVEEDAVATISGHAAPLIELADELGIRAHEGVEMVERLLAGQHPRLIGSTIDVDDLRRQLDTEAIDEPTTALSHSSTTFGATAGVATAEDAIRMMWVELLGVDEIADDDDFFELGGHSLVAIRLMSRIHKELSVRLQLATIFEASTVGTLANRVREERPDIDQFLADQSGPAASADGASTVGGPTATAVPSEMTRHLVPITTKGPGRPLYIVHGAGGNVLFLWSLARAMAGERPILGFQAHGIEGNDLPDTSIEAMAARYIAELRAHAPGPYLIGGFSGGGLVALEMTRQLRDLGETVDLTVLFDSPRAGQAWPSRTQIWRRVTGHLFRRGLGAVKPYLRSTAKFWVRRFIPISTHRTAEHEQDEIELGMADTAAHGFVNLFHYFGATSEKYHMTSYPSDVLLLKADTVWPTQAWDYGWGEHVEGQLDIRVVPGDHNSMFYPENAPALARVLSAELVKRD
ncbi:MAG TPA: SDR family NAD(P)-dependent oxidoreductase [Ilumatobacteraceae bacterium]|nr:SDR family NAD(P)-dependent oxidoreductase [Ilumatobacteraceae bacterium]